MNSNADEQPCSETRTSLLRSRRATNIYHASEYIAQQEVKGFWMKIKVIHTAQLRYWNDERRRESARPRLAMDRKNEDKSKKSGRCCFERERQLYQIHVLSWLVIVTYMRFVGLQNPTCCELSDALLRESA